MGLDPGLVQAGSSTLASLFNIGSQALTNAKNRRQDEKMFNWANDTYLTNWGLENEYNSPKNQMKRLKEAGINSHLAFAGGGVSNQASSIGSASPKPGSAEAPSVDAGLFSKIFMNFVDLEQKRADIDLIKAQTDTAKQDVVLRTIQGQTAGFDLGQKKALAPGQLTAQQLSNRKTEMEIGKIGADTKYTIDQNDRAKILQDATLKKMADDLRSARMNRTLTNAHISEVKQRISNMVLDGKLKDLELKYGMKGIFDAVFGSGESFVNDLPIYEGQKVGEGVIRSMGRPKRRR